MPDRLRIPAFASTLTIGKSGWEMELHGTTRFPDIVLLEMSKGPVWITIERREEKGVITATTPKRLKKGSTNG